MGNTGQPKSISSLYALIDSSVTVPVQQTQSTGTNNSGPTSYTYPSPLSSKDPGTSAQWMPLLLDKLTTVNASELPPRININTAPQEVLATLPGLSDSDIQTILNTRPDPSTPEPPDTIFSSTAWLITEARLSASQLQTLEKYITAKSQVYRVQSVGYFDGGGPTARIEAVVDTNGGRPRIVYWRDLTQFGKGLHPRTMNRPIRGTDVTDGHLYTTAAVVSVVGSSGGANARRSSRLLAIRRIHFGTLPGP